MRIARFQCLLAHCRCSFQCQPSFLIDAPTAEWETCISLACWACYGVFTSMSTYMHAHFDNRNAHLSYPDMQGLASAQPLSASSSQPWKPRGQHKGANSLDQFLAFFVDGTRRYRRYNCTARRPAPRRVEWRAARVQGRKSTGGAA